MKKKNSALTAALAMAAISASSQNFGCEKASNTSRDATEAERRLKDLRQQIDSLDSEIIETLAQRMHICLAVGKYKKEHGLAVVQSNRYNEIVEKRSRLGTAKGLGEDFTKQLVELIHRESVRQQREITARQ